MENYGGFRDWDGEERRARRAELQSSTSSTDSTRARTAQQALGNRENGPTQDRDAPEGVTRQTAARQVSEEDDEERKSTKLRNFERGFSVAILDLVHGCDLRYKPLITTQMELSLLSVNLCIWLLFKVILKKSSLRKSGFYCWRKLECLW